MSILSVNSKEPIAAWIPSLDDVGNGTTTLTDLVGDNNGTLTNMDTATDWVTDTAAGGVRALYFNGVNGGVLCGSTTDIFGTEFAISCWARLDPAYTSNRADFVAKHNYFDSAAAFQFGYNNLNNTRLGWSVSNTNNRFGTAPFIDDNWHHFLLTLTASTQAIYVDGTLQVSGANGGFSGVASNSVELYVGRSRFTYLRGRIDDIRIFDMPLDAADRSYLYAGGAGRGITAEQGSMSLARFEQTRSHLL